jgi:lambda repressor-like predicted transcriptional regulator
MTLPFTPHVPLSNPLTAEDNGSYASIEIEPFVMAIPERSVHLDAGAIDLLSHETVYYVYFDDPRLGRKRSTLPFYNASISSVMAGYGGRFFVGSIRTPAKDSPPTIGNGDGGAPSDTTDVQTNPGLSRSASDPEARNRSINVDGTPGDTAEVRTDLGISAPTSEPDVTNPANKRASFVQGILEVKGWSVLDWAKDSGVDYNTARDYLAGKTKPYSSTRKKFADSLGVKVEELPR